MAASVSIYATNSMATAFTNDNTYTLPISFGSLSAPIDGVAGETQTPFPVWIKNSGDVKLTDIVLSAVNGEVNIKGGMASGSDDAYVEFSLDNDSNLPNAQVVAPSSFVAASSSIESPSIIITNVSTVGNVKKLATTDRADDDQGTMMANEYSIVWLRVLINAQKSPGGALPASSGIKNIKMSVVAKGF